MAVEGASAKETMDAALVHSFGRTMPFAWVYVVQFTVANDHAAAMARHYATHPLRFVGLDGVGEARVHRHLIDGGDWQYRVTYEIADHAVTISPGWECARRACNAEKARQQMQALAITLVARTKKEQQA